MVPARTVNRRNKGHEQTKSPFSAALEVPPSALCGRRLLVLNVNRHWNGTPDRRPKGTPLIDVFWW